MDFITLEITCFLEFSKRIRSFGGDSFEMGFADRDHIFGFGFLAHFELFYNEHFYEKCDVMMRFLPRCLVLVVI